MAKFNSSTLKSPSDIRAAWEQAVAHLRAVEKEYIVLSAQHSAAFDEAEAACPREGEFFTRYDLGCFENKEVGRERNFNAARSAVVRERSREAGRSLTFVEAEEARAEALRIVDRFDAWQKRRDEVHAHYDCDRLERRFDALCDKRFKAQLAVIQVAAPDLDALRVKLELLAAMMDGEQDQSRVAAIRDDVKRLLAA